MVEIALQFGPAEYFALMVFAFVTVAAVLGSSTVRGLTTLFIGLLLGLVGIDETTGQMRFAFGVPELLDGVDVVVLAVGLFAVGEALYVAAYQSRAKESSNDCRLAADDERATGGAHGRHGCARPASGFRSARSPRAGRRSRRFFRMPSRKNSRSIRRNSAMARSKAWPDPRRPTTRRPPACWCRC